MSPVKNCIVEQPITYVNPVSDDSDAEAMPNNDRDLSPIFQMQRTGGKTSKCLFTSLFILAMNNHSSSGMTPIGKKYYTELEDQNDAMPLIKQQIHN